MLKRDHALIPSGSYLAYLAAGIVSAALLVALWQVRPPAPFLLAVGDPATSASHFFAPETSEGVSFRWSKDMSAVSIPALASRQTISVKANPARPAGSPAPVLRVFVGDRLLGEFRLAPGWQTYTVTTTVGLSPDIRLVFDTDTFYPSASDRRRLGAAVAGVSTSAQPGKLGLTWPPALWLLAGLLCALPLLLVAGERASPWLIPLLAPSALAPPLLAFALPISVALPAVAWLWGLATGFALMYRGWRDLAPRRPLAGWLQRLFNSRWQLLAVAAGSAVLSIALTWPLAAHMADHLPGWPGDNFAFLYKFWWFRTALFVRHQNPFFDPNTFSPFGFSLGQGEPTLVNTLPGAFLGLLVGDVASYNLLSLSSFVVSALGAYLLVREVAASKVAGALAAVAFAFAPYRMTQFAGHIQLLGTGWIAFTFYFAERALRTGRARYGAFCGLSLAAAALSAWYYGYMVGLTLAVYVAARYIAIGKAVPAMPLVRAGVAAAAAFAVVALPVALPSLSLWGQGTLSHSAKAADENSAAPVDFLIPNELHPLWGEFGMVLHNHENVLESSLYIGAGVAAIALAGWWLGRKRHGADAEGGGQRRGTAWAWLTVLIITFVLALGLTLHDTSGQTKVGGQPVPLPGQLLFDWLPFYSSMRAYSRFGVLSVLAAVVLMGWWWRRIAARWPERATSLGLVALLLVLVDFWTAPYPWGMTRVVEDPAARYLASAPPGTIIEMPLTAALFGPSLYDEVYYGKPIAFGYDTFEPPAWSSKRPELVDFPSDAALDLFKSWNVRYIVVSGNAYGADWPGTLAYLRSLPRLRFLTDFTDTRAWLGDPQLLDARPDLEQYIEPDNKAIFELTR